MTLIERHEIPVDGSHYQFDLADVDAETDPEALESPDDRAWPSFSVGRGLVKVGTASYFPPAPLVVELHDEAPELDEDWDHVAEGSLELTGDELAIGLFDFQSLPVRGGVYRVRASGRNLDAADTEESGGDRYRVQLWPAPASPPVIVKCWSRL